MIVNKFIWISLSLGCLSFYTGWISYLSEGTRADKTISWELLFHFWWFEFLLLSSFSVTHYWHICGSIYVGHFVQLPREITFSTFNCKNFKIGRRSFFLKTGRCGNTVCQHPHFFPAAWAECWLLSLDGPVLSQLPQCPPHPSCNEVSLVGFI